MSQELKQKKPINDDIFDTIISPDILEKKKSTKKEEEIKKIDYEQEYLEAAERLQAIYNDFNKEYQIDLDIRLLTAFEVPISALNKDYYELNYRTEYHIRFKHIEICLLEKSGTLEISENYRIYGYNGEFYGFEVFDKKKKKNVQKKK